MSSCGSPCTILGLAKYGYASRLPAYAIRIPGTVDGLFPIDWPRVPGHEAVGRIDALGAYAQGWVVGQRVGVGFLGGSCGYCEYCRGGNLVNCRNQEFTGIHRDGGYAEMLMARAHGERHGFFD